MESIHNKLLKSELSPALSQLSDRIQYVTLFI
jgi:hypothetical protein